MSEYIDRAYIVVPLDKVDLANGLAAQADPDTGGNQTFSSGTELSENGAAPATHRAASTLVKESGKAAIIAALPNVPGGAYYFESEGWTFEAALADLGLVVIEAQPN